MSPIVEQIAQPIELGEGPHWDEVAKALYYVDIFASTIHKYVPATKKHTFAKVGEKSVSLIVPVKGDNGKFVIGYGGQLAVVSWDGVAEQVSDLQVVATIDARANNRINDGKVSPSGILYAGSMSYPLENGEFEQEVGVFASFKNSTVKQHLDKITISNGLCWSLDEKTFYYIDSATYKIDSFDYDKTKDELSNRKTIFELKKNGIPGTPDGMVIVVEGKLWFACFGGHQVVRIDPSNGKVLSKIEFPAAPRITSLAFGGKNLDELYVTSAYVELTDAERKKYPQSGAVFKVTNLGTKGFAGVSFAL